MPESDGYAAATFAKAKAEAGYAAPKLATAKAKAKLEGSAGYDWNLQQRSSVAVRHNANQSKSNISDEHPSKSNEKSNPMRIQ